MTPVIAMAAPGLAGDGDVLAMGTWDVAMSKTSSEGDSENERRFIRNLLLWLARTPQ
jgi:hypothetical protein